MITCRAIGSGTPRTSCDGGRTRIPARAVTTSSRSRRRTSWRRSSERSRLRILALELVDRFLRLRQRILDRLELLQDRGGLLAPRHAESALRDRRHRQPLDGRDGHVGHPRDPLLDVLEEQRLERDTRRPGHLLALRVGESRAPPAIPFRQKLLIELPAHLQDLIRSLLQTASHLLDAHHVALVGDGLRQLLELDFGAQDLLQSRHGILPQDSAASVRSTVDYFSVTTWSFSSTHPMGKIRDMAQTKAGDRTEAEHVIALMVLASWADGKVVGSEVLAIQRLAAANPLLAHLRTISEIADDTRARLQEKGMDACLAEACGALRDLEYRELAFQCCAKVMGADRAFPVEEESVLRKLQDLLGFDAAKAERLLVLAMR